MRTSALWRHGFSISTAALLAGCGAAPSPLALPSTQVQAHHARSWMAKGLKTTDLLYVDVGGGIDVFTYPQGKAVGEITGEDLDSDGICSDKNGNVYVPIFEQYKILEFAHGGTTPIATLDMRGYEFPMTCALDPLTGNLAVTLDNGGVGIFEDAKYPPAYYFKYGVYITWYCTYDGSGNLFAGGYNASDGFTLTELPYGSATLRSIDVPAEIAPRLGMQWDGNYLAIEAEQDLHSALLLRVSVSGSTATVVGKTRLKGAPNTIGTEFWLADGEVVQPYDGNASVGFWKYPAGGKAVNSLQGVGGDLFALTVSYGKKK